MSIKLTHVCRDLRPPDGALQRGRVLCHHGLLRASWFLQKMALRSLFAMALLAISSSNALATSWPNYVVSGVVSKVSDNSIIQFRGKDERFRLWGILTKSDDLRSFLVGMSLYCIASAQLIVENKPIPLLCMEDNGNRTGRGIQAMLLEMALATEVCEESGGMYGYCQHSVSPSSPGAPSNEQ